MKIKGLLLALLSVCMMEGMARNSSTVCADSLVLGNCTAKTVAYESVGSSKVGGFALSFTAENMALYKGCSVDAIYIGISDWKQIKQAELFISRSLDGKPDYKQSFTPARNNWNRVELTTPYVIGDGPVYIGYVLEGVTALAMTESRKPADTWVRKDTEWAQYDDVYSPAFCAVVTGNSLPRHNVRLAHAVMPEYGVTGEPLPLNLQIENQGVETVTSIDLNYRLNDKTHTVRVDGLDIPSMNITRLDVNQVVVDAAGDYLFDFSLDQINGQPDEDMSDNVSMQVALPVRDQIVMRKPLLEIFSTELCTACPSAHNYISKKLAGRHDVVEIGHHAGFYTDKLTVDQSVAYEWFYEPKRLFAPALMWDRSNLCAKYPDMYGAATPVVSFSQSHFDRMLDIATHRPAYASVDLSVQGVSGTRRINIHVEGERLLPFEGMDTRLFVMLTEDSIYSERQAGASKGFYHRHVLRHSLTDVWGMPVDLESGYQADFEFEVPDSLNADKMHAVAFVSNYNADDRNDCQVLNAEWVPLKNLMPQSISGQLMGEAGVITVHDGILTVPAACSAVALYTPDGRMVYGGLAADGRLDISFLTPGVYVVKAVTGSVPVVQKIVM